LGPVHRLIEYDLPLDELERVLSDLQLAATQGVSLPILADGISAYEALKQGRAKGKAVTKAVIVAAQGGDYHLFDDLDENSDGE